MTICFTLPYSSGGCEERRIKFDLLTAIIKCSLLASIKARRLMLTWLTLMQPCGRQLTSHFSSRGSFCHLFKRVCMRVCGSARACKSGRPCVCVLARVLLSVLHTRLWEGVTKLIFFFQAFAVSKCASMRRLTDLQGSCGIYNFFWSRLISTFGDHSDTIT